MKRVGALFLVAMIAAACGGGGGGGDDSAGGSGGGSANVSGFWRGVATVSENTCSLPLDLDAINFSAAVTQNGDAVVLVDELNETYTGSVVNDGFVVSAPSAPFSFPLKTDCNLVREVQYHGISSLTSDGNTETADVVYGYRGTCVSQAGECRLSFTGTAERGPAPSPSPVVTGTPNPSERGACSGIVNDVYQGDGGCGISSTGFTVSTGGFVLNPFGANGSVTFVTSTTDSSIASAGRSDLSIAGAPGYSCSAVCQPPSKFTVTCTAGSQTCSETF